MTREISDSIEIFTRHQRGERLKSMEKDYKLSRDRIRQLLYRGERYMTMIHHQRDLLVGSWITREDVIPRSALDIMAMVEAEEKIKDKERRRNQRLGIPDGHIIIQITSDDPRVIEAIAAVAISMNATILPSKVKRPSAHGIEAETGPAPGINQ